LARLPPHARHVGEHVRAAQLVHRRFERDETIEGNHRRGSHP
jgi:hypothetical protein